MVTTLLAPGLAWPGLMPILAMARHQPKRCSHKVHHLINALRLSSDDDDDDVHGGGQSVHGVRGSAQRAHDDGQSGAAVGRDDDGDDDRRSAVVRGGDDGDRGSAVVRGGGGDGVHGSPSAIPSGCQRDGPRDVVAAFLDFDELSFNPLLL
ncbi:hypothetical protein ACLKA6_007963 [Drosophila palustris]